MGLGPVVCTECRVFADLLDSGDWGCPVCGDYLSLGHLWEQKDRDAYEENTKFIDFARGDK